MTTTKTLAMLALSAAFPFITQNAHAQAAPTATQALRLSAFGGATGTYTNFLGGKNGSLTLGADLTFLATPYVKPSFELRGTAPLDSGHLDGQFNLLLGPRVEYPFHRLHPYVDFLIGRGLISYKNGGFPYNGFLYLSSSSFVYSTGLGLDYDLTDRWGLKADFQYQHWHTPFYTFDSIHPKATTFGVVYRFDFTPTYHLRRSKH
jgi:opacity protein-like surface antigen